MSCILLSISSKAVDLTLFYHIYQNGYFMSAFVFTAISQQVCKFANLIAFTKTAKLNIEENTKKWEFEKEKIKAKWIEKNAFKDSLYFLKFLIINL